MGRNRIVPYDPRLRSLARALRKHGTLAEVVLWGALRARALGVEFHRQVPVDAFILDFYCHEKKLAIEVDGSSHDDEAVLERDAKKDSRLRELGIKVLRFTNRDVLKALGGVIDMIMDTIAEIPSLWEEHPPTPPSKGD